MSSFIKKQSAGFYMMAIVCILEVFSLIFYMINCSTDYFSRTGGVSAGLLVSALVAIVITVIYLIGSNHPQYNELVKWLPIINGIVLMITFMLWVNLRAFSIATILSFEKSDQTMADLSSAIIGMVLAFLAVLFNIIGAFFKVVKQGGTSTISIESEK